MNLDNVERLAAIAAMLGISRQGLTQGLARSLDPPKPVTVVAGVALYDITEVTEWWQRRCAGQAAEWKEKREARSVLPTAQVNIRVTAEEYARLVSLKGENESISGVVRRIFRAALAD